ncbi:MAG TPA: hypothetical protein VGD14_04995 [bacterium]
MQVLKYIIKIAALLFITGCSRQHHNFDLLYSDAKRTCVTFVRRGEINHYIAYRIVEHEPEITDHPISDYAGQPKRANYPSSTIPDTTLPGPTVPKGTYTDGWMSRYQDEQRYFRSYYNSVAHFRYKEDEGLYRVVVLKAVADGVDVWAWLESEKEIPGSYIVQACFRLSGATNKEWRQRIAFIPELSEFDLWATGDTLSLTYIRQNNAWRSVEAMNEKVTYYTPTGIGHIQKQNIDVDSDRVVPHGLVTRESVDGKSVAGMYWERTTGVSNHHPADCLHSFIDLGPVKPGEKNILHGKLYWFKGNKDDLLRHWQKDFKK